MTPKKLEKCLRQQGLTRRPYRLLIGELREMARMLSLVRCQYCPMTSCHGFFLLFVQSLDKYGKKNKKKIDPFFPTDLKMWWNRVVNFILDYHVGKCSFTWMGPMPVVTVTVTDNEIIKTILTRINEFTKPSFKELEGLLLTGLAPHEGAKWAKHRKIISPAFHAEKLKLVVEAACLSSQELIGNWEHRRMDALLVNWMYFPTSLICRMT